MRDLVDGLIRSRRCKLLSLASPAPSQSTTMTDTKQHYEPLATADDAAPPTYEAAAQGNIQADVALLSTRATPVKAVQPVRSSSS